MLSHQRRALRRQVPILLAVLFVASGLVALVFWNHDNRAAVLAWLGVQWLYFAFGAWRWWRRARIENPRAATKRFVRRSIITNLLPGVIWGSAAILFFTPDRFDHVVLEQAFTLRASNGKSGDHKVIRVDEEVLDRANASAIADAHYRLSYQLLRIHPCPSCKTQMTPAADRGLSQ